MTLDELLEEELNADPVYQELERTVRILINRWHLARGAERVFIQRQLQGIAHRREWGRELIDYYCPDLLEA